MGQIQDKLNQALFYTSMASRNVGAEFERTADANISKAADYKEKTRNAVQSKVNAVKNEFTGVIDKEKLGKITDDASKGFDSVYNRSYNRSVPEKVVEDYKYGRGIKKYLTSMKLQDQSENASNVAKEYAENYLKSQVHDEYKKAKEEFPTKLKEAQEARKKSKIQKEIQKNDYKENAENEVKQDYLNSTEAKKKVEEQHIMDYINTQRKQVPNKEIEASNKAIDNVINKYEAQTAQRKKYKDLLTEITMSDEGAYM